MTGATGDDRILLGDCLRLMPALPEGSVDLVLTDPPYNTGIRPHPGSHLRHFFPDSYTDEDYARLASRCSGEFMRLLKPDRAAYVFMNWKQVGLWTVALRDAGFAVKNVIVWDKVCHGLNYQNYAYSYELLIFAVKGRFFPRNRGGSEAKPAFSRDLWRVRRVRTRELRELRHPTPKPVELCAVPVRHATAPGELVFDPFLGSGSTAVAAKMLGRRFLGIERDPAYYRTALRRLSRLAA